MPIIFICNRRSIKQITQKCSEGKIELFFRRAAAARHSAARTRAGEKKKGERAREEKGVRGRGADEDAERGGREGSGTQGDEKFEFHHGVDMAPISLFLLPSLSLFRLFSRSRVPFFSPPPSSFLVTFFFRDERVNAFRPGCSGCDICVCVCVCVCVYPPRWYPYNLLLGESAAFHGSDIILRA